MWHRRITHIISTYPPIGGGSEYQCQALAQRQARAGMHVEVVTRAMSDAAPVGTTIEDGVSVIRLPTLRGRLPGGLGFLAHSSWVASGCGPDIIHAHQALSPALAAVAASPLCGAKVVVKLACTGPFGEVHEMQGPLLSLRRRMLGRADRIVVLSEDGRAEALSLGLDPRRIVKIPNGVDTVRFSPPDPARRADRRAALGLSGYVILWTGRLTHQKSPELLVEATSRLPSELAASVVMVGDGPERDHLAQVVRERGLDSRVKFLGWRGDVPDLLAAADVFVLTSQSEGMSNALLEAMATGRIVIATDIPANREVVDPQVTGLLSPADPDAIAHHLVQAYTDMQTAGGDPFLTSLGRNARHAAEQRFSLDAVASRYNAIYDRLAVD